jgi:CRP/FNR family cyclic AMP-dependent transcriptional regulator
MESHVSTLQKVSFCAQLPVPVIDALARVAIPLERAESTMLQVEGDPAEAMYIVVSGRVKISRLSAGGREQILNVIPRGGHFNTIPMFDNGPCPANAEALTSVSLLMLPRRALLRVVEEHPPLALALLHEFTGRVRHLVNLVDDLALHTVQGRVAGLLIAQAEAAESGIAIEPLTQADMAARLGTVREMVGRTLKTFEALGLISIERGAITIRDHAGLMRQYED